MRRNIAEDYRQRLVKSCTDARTLKFFLENSLELFPEKPSERLKGAERFKAKKDFAGTIGWIMRSPLLDLYTIDRGPGRAVQEAAQALIYDSIKITHAPDLLHTPCGFLALADPISVSPSGRGQMFQLGSFAWLSSPGGNGVEVVVFQDLPNGLAVPVLCFVSLWGRTVGVDDYNWERMDEHDGFEVERTMTAFFWALCLFLKQKILTAQVVHPDRASIRQAAREGEIARDFRTITLREKVYAKGEDGGPVDWSCRWLVRPHWRNQWYPSKRIHRPRFIGMYEKGPEDKPLRGLAQRHFEIVR